MKSKVPGLMAIVLAVSLSAFTSHQEKKMTGYYWFPLDAVGAPQQVNTLMYSSADPYLCTVWAPGGYCSAAFTSYSGTQAPYSAAGVKAVVHFSLFH